MTSFFQKTIQLATCLSLIAGPLLTSASAYAVGLSASGAQASQRDSGQSQSVTAPVKSVTFDETWRKAQPTVPDPRPFKLPAIVDYKMPNGLEVELVEDHRFPFISAYLGTRAGSILDPAEAIGTADMTGDMLSQGTKTRTSKQIADEVDFIGGALVCGSDYDWCIVSGSALSKYTERLLGVMSDVLLNPSFPEEELKLKKENLLQELIAKRAQPEFLASERFQKVVFGSHPYSVVAPTPANVSQITRDGLKAFHDKYYLPNNSVFVIVGDFDPIKLKEMLQKKFGDDWKAGALPTATFPEPKVVTEGKIYLIDRPDSVQSSIKVGNLAIKRTDPDYFPMIVANQILGGASGRLFMNIREQKGYTYGAYSGLAAHRLAGYFASGAEVRTEVTAPSLEEFFYELERMRTLKVGSKELKEAQTYLAGSFQLGLETQSGLAHSLLDAKMFNLPNDYLETYTSNITKVNPVDVRRVARRMIQDKGLIITVVGDASKIKQDLEFFGPVEVYDSTGKITTDTKPDNNHG